MAHETDTIHVFERAGLGRAPFRCLGVTEHVYQAIPGDPTCPIQPGTSCDYCAQGIRYAANIVDADGKRFKVGCDCVEKTGDRGLRRIVDRQVAKRRREQDHTRKDRVISEAATLLERADVRAALAAEPHTRATASAYFADKSALDEMEWLMEHAGRAGKSKAAKRVIQFAKERGL